MKFSARQSLLSIAILLGIFGALALGTSYIFGVALLAVAALVIVKLPRTTLASEAEAVAEGAKTTTAVVHDSQDGHWVQCPECNFYKAETRFRDVAEAEAALHTCH